MTFAQRLAEVRSGKKRERYTSYLARIREVKPKRKYRKFTDESVPRILKIDWNCRA